MNIIKLLVWLSTPPFLSSLTCQMGSSICPSCHLWGWCSCQAIQNLTNIQNFDVWFIWFLVCEISSCLETQIIGLDGRMLARSRDYYSISHSKYQMVYVHQMNMHSPCYSFLYGGNSHASHRHHCVAKNCFCHIHTELLMSLYFAVGYALIRKFCLLSSQRLLVSGC